MVKEIRYLVRCLVKYLVIGSGEYVQFFICDDNIIVIGGIDIVDMLMIFGVV